ncbi:hypothetical protein AK830_g1434 [Neonectria ditissima]|uniref:gamma-glutamylcyclotransferase n=1 Tax=Neonectria ditissima TaxID=78410 RepID=A0A0P7BIM1_9HYPO|nr:hypothetical protein AK830_g1434 [Neonectria ditissima]
MASDAIGTTPAAGLRPPKYYFAYGSNLHLRQMKRRCPESKFIGCARLSHHRWQINERGYANVVEADGQWVDGLVYEIDEKDEARLDINEGVSKNAYTKRYMTVLLHRAQSPLYRRPTAWIVDKGGPAKVRQLADDEGHQQVEYPQHWQKDVLVYISLNYIVDSKPKEEYVNRINFGINDARALGVGDDYISNCIRPFVPPNQKRPLSKTKKAGKPREPGGGGGGGGNGGAAASGGLGAPRGGSAGSGPARRDQSPMNEKNRQQGVKRGAAQRSGTPSPARRTQAPPRPVNPSPQRTPAANLLVVTTERRRAQSDVGAPAPALPPRPTRRMRSIPVIVVDERPNFVRMR